MRVRSSGSQDAKRRGVQGPKEGGRQPQDRRWQGGAGEDSLATPPTFPARTMCSPPPGLHHYQILALASTVGRFDLRIRNPSICEPS